MKIISGKDSVHKVLKKIEKIIDEHAEKMPKSSLNDKAKESFYELLLCKTFVFYVPKDSIKMSMIDASIDEVDKIIFVENLSEIMALTNLSLQQKNRYKMNWIVVEFDASYGFKDDELSIYLPFLSTACELDYLKKDTDKKVNYRIDFEKLEKQFERFGKPSFLIKNAKKHFFQSLFSIQLTEQKSNEINFVEQVLKPIKYLDISISNEYIKSVFLYNCQICGKQHQVILSKSKRGKKKNSSLRYTRVDDKFIYKKEGRYYINCDHSNTKYKNQKVQFSVSENAIFDESKELDIDKIFLFIFFNFVLNQETNEIEFYLNNKINRIEVESFIQKVK